MEPPGVRAEAVEAETRPQPTQARAAPGAAESRKEGSQ